MIAHRVFSEPLDEHERIRAEGALGVPALFVAWDEADRSFGPGFGPGAHPGAVLTALGRIIKGDWTDLFGYGRWMPEPQLHPLVVALWDELLR